MNLKFGLAALLISSFLASIVQFNFGKTEIVSRMFTPELVKAGDNLDFSLNLNRTYLFDDETGKAL